LALWCKESVGNQLDWRQDKETAVFQDLWTSTRCMAARLKNCPINLSVTMCMSKEAGR